MSKYAHKLLLVSKVGKYLPKGRDGVRVKLAVIVMMDSINMEGISNDGVMWIKLVMIKESGGD
jgi:hypothetical protein